ACRVRPFAPRATRTGRAARGTRSSGRAGRSRTSSPLRPRSFALRGERDLGRADREGVARRELRALHALPVDLDAVRRVEVDDPVARALLPQLGVTPRDVRVLDLDVALAGAAEEHAALLDPHRLPVPGE